MESVKDNYFVIFALISTLNIQPAVVVALFAVLVCWATVSWYIYIFKINYVRIYVRNLYKFLPPDCISNVVSGTILKVQSIFLILRVAVEFFSCIIIVTFFRTTTISRRE